jgi:hypothetical protein
MSDLKEEKKKIRKNKMSVHTVKDGKHGRNS